MLVTRPDNFPTTTAITLYEQKAESIATSDKDRSSSSRRGFPFCIADEYLIRFCQGNFPLLARERERGVLKTKPLVIVIHGGILMRAR